MGARDPICEQVLDADLLVDAVFREFMAPPPLITVTEWAERYRTAAGARHTRANPWTR
jgi:hypothetical protein